MKRLLLLALLASLPFATHAQVVTTEPAIPVIDQPVTVTFHADRSDGMANYSGDVYVHTGVNDWDCVIESWGNNQTQPKLTQVGSQTYELQIDDIAAFYGLESCGIAPDEVQQLAMVFRSADAQTQTADLFVDVAQPGLNVAIVNPTATPLAPFIAEQDTTVEVTAVVSATSNVTAFELQLDGTQVATSTSDTLRYDLALMTGGRYDLSAIAENEVGERDTSSFYAVRNPEVVEEVRPQGLEDGITYDESDPTSATLSLFAPGKEYVYLIGDFSDWEVDPQYMMKRETAGADSSWFWLELTDLPPGEEVGFQYYVDGEIRVTDPYVEKVLTSNDVYIEESTYPNLKPYPAGLTDHIVGILQTDQPEYSWQIADFERPAKENLVIYELLLRDFLAAHDYETLIDTLGYLDRLGVNAIELMPVSEFDGNESWGYNPSFHFALDKYYGPPEELKRFVDAAHARGMAVILDVVYNHATGQSPLVRLWNEGDYGAPTADNPYANPIERHPFNVFNDLNHESPATQYWLDRANRYWMEEFNLDGYRFDLTKGFMQFDSFFNYNAGRVALLKRMTDEIWAADSDFFVIFEHLGENDEEQEYAHYRVEEGYPGILLWSNMNHNYNEAAMGYHDSGKSNLSWTYFGERGWTEPNNIAYMESHDEERLMYKNLLYGNASGDYDIKELPVALDRMKMAGAFFYTIPGPKMLWQFGELGYEIPIDQNGRTGNKPILWNEYWTNPTGEDVLRENLYETWSALIGLRTSYPTFSSAETEVAMDVNGVVKTMTLAHDSLDAVVVGNFGVTQRNASVDFPQTGTWYHFFSGEPYEVSSTSTTIPLVPGGFHLFVSEPVDFPAQGLVTVDNEGAPTAPDAFSLDGPAPNPVTDRATIRYATHVPGDVEVALYDMLGRSVRTLVETWQPAGPHQVILEADGLASGVYLLRLEQEGRALTRRIVITR